MWGPGQVCLSPRASVCSHALAGPAPESLPQLQFRRARPADAPAVADLFYEVGGRAAPHPGGSPGQAGNEAARPTPSPAVPWCLTWRHPPEPAQAFKSSSGSGASGWRQPFRRGAPPLATPPGSREGWEEQLRKALEAKAVASALSREARLLARVQAMRAELAALQGAAAAATAAGAGRAAAPPTASERAQQDRWLRQRAFNCLLAVDALTGEVVAGAALTLARPEAALPPPLPTTKRHRAYVSNVAVAPAWRRRGVASAVLARCERFARLARHDSLWLHVEACNAGARQLYESNGYEEVGRDPAWYLGARRSLLRKELPPLPPPAPAAVRGRSGEGGVFVWEVGDRGGGGGGGGSGGSGSGSGSGSGAPVP